jgi:trimethylamine corrinoid protein
MWSGDDIVKQDELNTKAKEAVLAYNAAAAKDIAKAAVDSGADLVDLINNGLTVGINEIGIQYEEKKLFLPHIMAGAAALNAAMEVLGPELEKGGIKTDSKMGKLVICTIEGDIHSIGKDIVAIMLKVAGFDVLNIGRDVPLAEIVDSVKKNSPRVLGTSALMTSTMVNQKTLEVLLNKEGVRSDILTNVGGAPVTQQWADEIGADIYSENASDAVIKITSAVDD